MRLAGVVWWRWVALAVYLALVGVLLLGVVTLVRAFPVFAFAVAFCLFASALAWPHRWWLRSLVPWAQKPTSSSCAG